MSIHDVQLDVLGSGREPDRRRWAGVAILLVVLLVVASGAWYADHRSRRVEFAAISRCAEQAQAAYDEGTARVAAMAEYVRPSLVFATEPTARGLYGMVAHEAASVDDGLQQARGGCAAVDVANWHRAQRAALRARLAYVDGQLAFLADTATDGQVYFQNRARITGLQAAAASMLAAARPGTL